MKSRKTLLALGLFLLLFFILGVLPQPTGYILDNWSLRIGDRTQTIKLPYYQFIDKSGLATFQTRFPLPEGDTLVIPKISCYAFEVKVNNYPVAQVGDFSNPTANIWNYAHIISLDKKFLKDENELLLNVYLLDDVGMHIPPFIEKQERVLQRISLFNFINTDMHLIMLGISISVAFILLAISFSQRTDKGMFFYLGLGTILVSLYSFDCQYRLYSGDLDTFLFFRKVLFALCYSSGIFLILGIEKYINKDFPFKKIIFPIFILAIILVLASTDFVSLRSRINILNLLMVISPISVLILLIRYQRKNLYFSSVFLTIIVAYTVLSVFLKANTPYLFHYGIMVYAIGLGTALIFEFSKMYNEKKQIQQKYLVDTLTQAYNRNILEEKRIADGDILILMDVDNFKQYNDNFGHSKGDLLLKELVNLIKGYIGEEDMIIRYGGDEFLIVLKDKTCFAAENIISSIRQKIIHRIGDKKIDISFGIIEYKADFSTSFDAADKLMYRMKLEKKFTYT